MRFRGHMARIVRDTAAVLLVLAFTGGHWMILQTAAWAKMIVDYSRAAPLKTAIEQTFDGEHPCSMCKAIRQARQPAKDHELQPLPERDLSLFVEARPSGLIFLPYSGMKGTPAFLRVSHEDPPPIPPPKFPECA